MSGLGSMVGTQQKMLNDSLQQQFAKGGPGFGTAPVTVAPTTAAKPPVAP